MTFYIRKAILDDAPNTAPLIYEAIGDIANRLTGETETSQILACLEVLFRRTDNRHSYLHTYIAEDEVTKDILGILVVYNGQVGAKLDASLQRWLEQKNAPITSIDVEAYPDEFYIDTVCVHRNARGLGIGTALLHFAEEVALSNDYTKVSLNVETQKVKAKKLYERLGYVVTEPWTIIDEPFFHMVKTII
ncbi:GNAT family N-acetyltransferase [Lysinibacillus sp. SGAir0095]|uniref:GNAT family N-acetyltransferase n=1 Tax=Lysinibacillus sp. SGAir0095 TaxID=2070463 RepID=UPI0010CCE896|nr:GNAT family N-acetyltransferase [Lysinibacillus sp. SGAir0095]QCR30796.1 GNAT family N-acetyltransferase [Lysinibacillus sp. SGAir0095]